jgi:hypothetical protein
MQFNILRSAGAALMLGAVLALSGCATTPRPDIRTDYDHKADFSLYRTYGFPAEIGTDRGGYSTLMTKYFKEAVQRGMEVRGYKYSADHPDLLVNFYTNTRHVSDVVSTPGFSPGWGYFGYRYGLYSAWPLYDRDIETVQYKVGTANVDIVDAAKKQLIWEGVAEGRVTETALDNQQANIDSVVAQLLEKFPGRAATNL